MANQTKNIRAMLATALNKAIEGNLPVEDGKNIIGLANQISHSMTAEVKVMNMKIKSGQQVEHFGNLSID